MTVEELQLARLATVMRASLVLSEWDYPRSAALALGAAVHLAVAAGLGREGMKQALDELYDRATARPDPEAVS